MGMSLDVTTEMMGMGWAILPSAELVSMVMGQKLGIPPYNSWLMDGYSPKYGHNTFVPIDLTDPHMILYPLPVPSDNLA